MTGPLLDAVAREAAASRLDANLVVTAGAGTGKTSLLVERVLHLILSAGCPLGRIRAVTFTEKAAAEMKRRVAEALEETIAALSAPAPASYDEAREAGRVLQRLRKADRGSLLQAARAARGELDQADIGTLHAFCTELLRRHPREAGLPPGFVVESAALPGAVFEALWAEFLAEELGPRGTRAPLWSRVLAAFRLQDIEEVARMIHASPAIADHLAGGTGASPDARALLGEEAARLSRELGELIGAVTTSKGKLPRLMRTARTLLERFASDGLAALHAADPSSFEFPEIWTYEGTLSSGPRNPRDKEIQEAVKSARTLLQGLHQIREAEIADLLDALAPLCRAMRRRVLREGRVGFDDLLLLARNLLRDHPGVRREEARRIHALLIDEFQDTDPLQYDIAFYLAGGEEAPGSDPWALPLPPGRVFIVGDPKQSIYRFRGADMAAFRRAVDRVSAHGMAAVLSVNFRSVPGILESVNRLFAGWIGEISDRSVDPDYDPLAPHRSGNGEEPCVELWSVTSPPGSRAWERRTEEGKVLAAEIRQWIDREGRSFRDIAVLYRSLTQIPLTTRALRRAGIPYVVEGGRAFAERPEVVEAFALLRALCDPSDPVPVLGVLRSALGGVPDDELAAYAETGGTFLRGTAHPEGFPRIDAIFRLLDRLESPGHRLPLDRWIQEVLTGSEFLLVQAGYEDGVQRVANLRKLAEHAAAIVRDGSLTLIEALEELEDAFAGERPEGESPLADEAVDAVRILSIHKAKGLEFPMVIIPDLGREDRPRYSSTEVRLHRHDSGAAVGVTVGGRRGMHNAAGLAVRRDRARHEIAEAKRLLYVAATRARDRLVLVNSSTSRLSPWLQALSRWGYTIDPKAQAFPPEGLLMPGVRHRVLEATALETRPPEDAPLDTLESHRRLLAVAARGSALRPPRFRNPSRDGRDEARDRDPDAAPSPPGSRDLARGVGLAVHAALERGDHREPEKLRSLLAREVERVFRDEGVDRAELEAKARRVLEGWLASDLAGELAAVEILGRELPVLAPGPDDSTVLGYVDLVYRREGRIHVADYKTDQETGPERAAAYRGQLEAYGSAVAGALCLETPPVLEVLFVRTGERVILAPGPKP